MSTTSRFVALGAMLLAAGAATACGAPAAQHGSAATIQTAPQPSSAPHPTPAHHPTKTSSGAGHRRVLSFVTPSGNIRCEGEPLARAIACVIGDRRWKPPGGDDRWCPVADLAGMEMALGHDAHFLCVTDVLMPGRDPVLAYGDSQTAGGFTCWSRRPGVTCTDSGDHHFLLGRRAYRLD
ncbi:MAG TPA: hypothetical protein VJ872_07220 [Nocardioides sp.]|nr:hypothetical protein [Nocardioides sp.]